MLFFLQENFSLQDWIFCTIFPLFCSSLVNFSCIPVQKNTWFMFFFAKLPLCFFTTGNYSVHQDSCLARKCYNCYNFYKFLIQMILKMIGRRQHMRFGFSHSRIQRQLFAMYGFLLIALAVLLLTVITPIMNRLLKAAGHHIEYV